jgi:hypothetical protein
MSLTVRAEFNNIFNRTYLNNPTTTGIGISPETPPTCKLPTGSNGTCAAGKRRSPAGELTDAV